MCSPRRDAASPAPGCPIRIPSAHRLPAAPRGVSSRGHVLHRPSTPRHPPCAFLRSSQCLRLDMQHSSPGPTSRSLKIDRSPAAALQQLQLQSLSVPQLLRFRLADKPKPRRRTAPSQLRRDSAACGVRKSGTRLVVAPARALGSDERRQAGWGNRPRASSRPTLTWDGGARPRSLERR